MADSARGNNGKYQSEASFVPRFGGLGQPTVIESVMRYRLFPPKTWDLFSDWPWRLKQTDAIHQSGWLMSNLSSAIICEGFQT